MYRAIVRRRTSGRYPPICVGRYVSRTGQQRPGEGDRRLAAVDEESAPGMAAAAAVRAPPATG